MSIFKIKNMFVESEKTILRNNMHYVAKLYLKLFSDMNQNGKLFISTVVIDYIPPGVI